MLVIAESSTKQIVGDKKVSIAIMSCLWHNRIA